MEFIVKLCNEAPVFELLAAVNRNQNFSFLMMKIIYTKCVKSTDVSVLFLYCCSISTLLYLGGLQNKCIKNS